MPVFKPENLKIGTPVYCVVRYRSGIHRVQKLVAGENGNFQTRWDGRPILQGNWGLPCFWNYENALDECRERNTSELTNAIKLSVRFQQMADNIYLHLHGIKNR